MEWDAWTPAYTVDRRANRLARWELQDDSETTRLMLCTSVRVVDHMRAGLLRLGLHVERSRPSTGELADWTHCLVVRGRFDGRARDFLELLQGVLVLTTSPGIDCALALDFYKAPLEGMDSMDWPNSEAGELVHRMKYWKEDREAAEAALGNLATRMAIVIRRDPVLADVTVLRVPGHDVSTVSWGERLGDEVARLAGRPIEVATAQTPLRAEAKARTERSDLMDEFSVPATMVGRRVLIVDDTYGQGATLLGVAAAAHRAGASAICGLVGARRTRR